MSQLPKEKLIFFDTNVLSAIGRQSPEATRKTCYTIMAEMKLALVLTPFNILELEKMPDEALREKVHDFLSMCNVVFFKPQNVIFADEIKNFSRPDEVVEPIMFITTLIGKLKYKDVLDNLRKNKKYHRALHEHFVLLKQLQAKLNTRLPATADIFVDFSIEEHLKDQLSSSEIALAKAPEHFPAYKAFMYSIYSKAGSKGLRKKSGEMNDTAMSYVFPYVGTIVTERIQANLFRDLKDRGKIRALEDTRIFKYSDIVDNTTNTVHIDNLL